MKDEDSDGMVSHCWYRAGAVMIIVSEVTYTSAAKAKQSTNAEYIKSQMGDDNANVVEEKGVGDHRSSAPAAGLNAPATAANWPAPATRVWP